jgi:hypothetical protein
VASARTTEEIVVPFPRPPEALGAATRVRSTLLVSSLQSIRRRGRHDDYLALLPTEHHKTILSLPAGQWVPMSLGEAHYLACDGLGFARDEQLVIGREVGDRVEGSFLATMVRMAGSVGATPWTALAQIHHLYDRLFDGGGGMSVSRRGPKDARMRFAGMSLARIPYYRGALAGVIEIGLQLFCTRAYVTDAPGPASPQSIVAMDLAWA